MSQFIHAPHPHPHTAHHPDRLGGLHRQDIEHIRAGILRHTRAHGESDETAEAIIADILAQFNVSPDGREMPARQQPHASRHTRRFHRGPHR